MSISLGAREYLTKRKSPSVPYDARVAWIQTDGVSSYINTGITPDLTSVINVGFAVAQDSTVSAAYSLAICGARSGTGTNSKVRDAIAVNGTNNTFRFYPSLTNDVDNPRFDKDFHECTITTAGYIIWDGVTIPASIGNSDFGNFTLGKSGTYEAAVNPSHFWGAAKFTHLKIYTNNVLVCDLIPVRKNGVGYMYDRVTGTLLGNQGTGDFVVGPDVPFDDEVEYIERDFYEAWMVNGAADYGGFNLSEYCDSFALATMTKRLDCTFCFSPASAGLAAAASISQQSSGGIGGFGVCIAEGKSNSSTFYAGWYSMGITPKVSSTESSLGNFHTMSIIPNGDTTASIQLDGAEVSSLSQSSTTVMTYFKVLVTNSKTVASNLCQMRVKNVRLGSDVYLIPVVKGNAVGFYNLVDGHLFLEEQACLSAGPVV